MPDAARCGTLDGQDHLVKCNLLIVLLVVLQNFSGGNQAARCRCILTVSTFSKTHDEGQTRIPKVEIKFEGDLKGPLTAARLTLTQYNP